jgi:nucleotide-binding universal stress UspA family protein
MAASAERPLATHVLVPLEFGGTAAQALSVAAHLAVRAGARLTALHVVTAGSPMRTLLAPANEVEARAAALVTASRERVGDEVRLVLPGTHHVAAAVENPSPSDGILRYASLHGADLICMTTAARRGWRRFVLGSVAAEIVRRTHVPVLALRRRDDAADVPFDELRNVLVAIDFYPGVERVVRVAGRLVTPGGRVTLAHVVETPAPHGLDGTSFSVPDGDVDAARAWSSACLERLVEDVPAPLRAPSRVVAGRAAEALLGIERELAPDVIVVGSHGRHGVERWSPGSVAERVVREAAGPVLVVPRG